MVAQTYLEESVSTVRARRYGADWLRICAWLSFTLSLAALVLNITHGPERYARKHWFQGDTLFPAHLVQDVLVDGSDYTTWRAPPAPFIFPDWFIVGSVLLVTGKPLVANLAFLVINTLVVTFAALGCNRLIGGANKRNREIVLALSLAFMFLLLDWDPEKKSRSAFLPAYHAGTFSFALLAVYLFLSIDKLGLERRKQQIQLVFLLAISFLLGLSDLITVCYLAAPLTAAFLLAVYFQRQDFKRSGLILAAIWICTVVGARLTDSVVMREDPGNLSTATLKTVYLNLQVFVSSAFADIAKMDVTHMALIALSVGGLAGLLHLRFAKRDDETRVDRTKLMFVAFGPLAAWAVICGLIFGGSCMLWREKNYEFCLHYWMPVFFMPFVLAPFTLEFSMRKIDPRSSTLQAMLLLAVAFQLIVSGGSAISRGLRPAEYSVWNYSPKFVTELDEVARKYDLKVGYGDYWDVRQVGLYSQELKMMPVLANPLVYFYWMTNKDWLNTKDDQGNVAPIEFVLTGGDHVNPLTPELVKMWLGEPEAEEVLGDPSAPNCHRVLIYKSQAREYGLSSLMEGYLPSMIVEDYPLEVPMSKFLFTTGKTIENRRVATGGSDAAGLLYFGPYLRFPDGVFHVSADLRCQDLNVDDGAKWDIGYVDHEQQQFVTLAASTLDQTSKSVDAEFEISAKGKPVHLEFRVFYPGKGSLEVGDVQITRQKKSVDLATVPSVGALK